MKSLKTIFITLLLLFTVSIGIEQVNAQLICEEVNGLNWCYNPAECGQPCNDVCAAGGMAPIPDNEAWFEGQNTEDECTAISLAFGLGNNVNLDPFTTACIGDALSVNHGPGLRSPINCSTSPGCPAFHRTQVDAPGVPCDSTIAAAQRSICPCVELTFTLVPEEATNDTGTDHTVTATLIVDGAPDVGRLIFFNVISGPNEGSSSDTDIGECTPDDCRTDSNGQVSWTYSSDLPGTDIIIATIAGTATDTNTVQKTWILVRNIPTLSQWGLIAMAVVLGIIGLLALRRRKAAV